MSDPVRMRDLAPELDSMLDDPSLDPPAGVEEGVWESIEGAIGARSMLASAPARSIAPPEAPEPARSVPAPAPRVVRVSFAQARFVVGALTVAAAAVLVIRGSEQRPARDDLQPTALSAQPPSAEPALPSPADPVVTAPPAAPSIVPQPIVTVSPTTAQPVASPKRRPPLEATASPDPPTRPPPEVPAANGVEPSANEATNDPSTLEAATVAEVRALLRAANGPAALARLEELDARMPGVARSEARESLRIEALVLSGKTDKAASVTAAFAEAYPNSPLLPRLQKLVASGERRERPDVRR